MTERSRGQRRRARETIRDGSRRSAAFTGLFQGATRLGLAITVAGLLAAVVLVVTEFSTVASVNVANGSCEVINDANPDLADRCKLSGFERNGGAFVVLAVLAAVMAWGAGIGGSRAAAIALAAVGIGVLAWALLVDLPVTHETGALGRDFEGATATAGIGLTLEIAAGVLALGAGAVRLLARDSAAPGRIGA